MAKSINNKTLLYILGALVLLFIGVKWYQKARVEKTLRTELIDVDTSKVSEILLYPACEKGAEIKFYREGNEWKVKKGQISAETESNTVKNLLSTLLELKVKSLASKDKKKWVDYQVTDSLATRVKVRQGKKVVADLYLGKFSYQPSSPNYGMYGGGGVTGTTYVRRANENEVYAVDGFLVFTFNQNFNMFRKQSVAKFEPSQVEKLQFKYPADSSFILELREKKWYVSGSEADSGKVASFINRLSYKSTTEFNDHFTPQGNALFALTIEGKSMKPVTIEAYPYHGDTMVVNSSINPRSWFNFSFKSLTEEIFYSKNKFLPENKKSTKK
ncbi:MAG: DUF4340 domain-containing protein [Bacteroidales bacterium]|nr:DUF4340 domain-containing protein [Bacteroidales bacterium]